MDEIKNKNTTRKKKLLQSYKRNHQIINHIEELNIFSQYLKIEKKTHSKYTEY